MNISANISIDIARRMAFLLLVPLALGVALVPAVAQPRLVPQLTLTNLEPTAVAFHPGDRDTFLVLNRSGRVDIFTIGDGGQLTKSLELPGVHDAVAFSPDGTRIVSNDVHALRLWRVADGTLLCSLEHGGQVVSLAFGHSGRRVVFGGRDGTVSVWNVEPCEPMSHSPYTHGTAVASVTFSADVTRTISAGTDGTVQVWHSAGEMVQAASLSVSDENEAFTFALSGDGTRLVAGGARGALRVLNIATGQTAGPSVARHSGRVTSVAFGSTGTTVVSGDSDGTVRLWNAETTGAISVPLQAHDDHITGVALSHDGSRVLSASEDGSVRLWDAERTQIVEQRRLGGHDTWVAAVTFTPTGFRLYSAGVFGSVQEWYSSGESANNATQLQRDGRTEDFQSLAFSTNGEHIVSGGRSNGVIQIWDSQSGSPIGQPLGRHGTTVMSVTFSRDGRRVVSGGDDGTVRIWDTQRGASPAQVLDTQQGGVTSVAFSFDGTYIASGGSDGTVALWTTQDLTPIVQPQPGHEGHVTSMAFSPDGTRLVSAGLDGNLLWDVRNPAAMQDPLHTFGGSTLTVAFSPDSRRIASAGMGMSSFSLWELQGPDVILLASASESAYGNNALAFSSDGTRIALGGFATVVLWEIVAAQELLNATVQGPTLSTVAVAPDRRRIAAGRSDGTVHLWTIQEQTASSLRLDEVHYNGVRTAAFSPDGATVATVANFGRTVHLWNAATGHATGELEHRWGRVLAVAFSPDSTRLASGDDDGVLRLWDVQHAELLREVEESERLNGPINTVAFSPEGTRLVSGSEDTLQIWDSASLQPILDPLPGRENAVTAARFAGNGRQIVSAYTDGTLRLWSAESGRQIHTLLQSAQTEAPRLTFGVSPDGSAIIFSVGGAIRLWDVTTDEPEEVDVRRHSALRIVGWSSPDVITGIVDNRVLFLDSELRTRGEVFLPPEGFVALIDGRGVYTTPPGLTSRILAFRGEENVPVQNVSLREIRRVILDDWDVLALVLYSAAQAMRVVQRIDEWFGRASVPGWLFVAWLLACGTAAAMWIFVPSHLASWTMTRGARGLVSVPRGFFWWQYFLAAALPFVWFGHRTRPLKSWVRRHRKELEMACFTAYGPVKERSNYCALGRDSELRKLRDVLGSENERALLWITGEGGSGKSALAIHLLQETMVDEHDSPLPVFVGEDWAGSLASHVARQLRPSRLRKGPTERMVRILGRAGLICPLVDSLSERGLTEARKVVQEAILEFDFRHLMVTSRDEPRDGETWREMRVVKTRALVPGEVDAFIGVYVDNAQNVSEVKEAIAPLVVDDRMPSALFLRFAVQQADREGLQDSDCLSLVVKHLRDLRAVREIDLDESSMLRSCGIAAIVSIQEKLHPHAFSSELLKNVLAVESNGTPFFDRSEQVVAPEKVLRMLVQSGVIEEWQMNLQFSYGPVAEYFAVWWMQRPRNEQALRNLRTRIINAGESSVKRAYEDVEASSGRTRY